MSMTETQRMLITAINTAHQRLPNDDHQQTIQDMILIRDLAHQVLAEIPELTAASSPVITSETGEDRFLIPGRSFIAYMLNRPMYKYRLLESLIAGGMLSCIIYVLYIAFVYKF